MPRQPEPRVLTEDVRQVIATALQPNAPGFGEAVRDFAIRSASSPRSVYRVLSLTAGEGTSPPSMMLDIADRMVVAAGRHLSECRVLLADGRVRPYTEVC